MNAVIAFLKTSSVTSWIADVRSVGNGEIPDLKYRLALDEVALARRLDLDLRLHGVSHRESSNAPPEQGVPPGEDPVKGW